MLYKPTESHPVVSRRTLLLGAGATAIAAMGARQVLAAAPRRIEARPGEARLHPTVVNAARIWGFDGAVPGPVLRVPQGERFQAELLNSLPQPTTIHWHGIRIDNAMDGVPHMTQHAVEPGSNFFCDFVAPDAGTFWYHPHERSYEQVARGLAGVLIVEEAVPPTFDRDEVLVLSDWRLGTDGALDETFGMPHDRGHAGRLGNVITVSGMPDPTFPIRRHERVRLRLINAASARIFRLRFEGLNARLIAIDGQPVAPTSGYGEGLTLSPGNRADVIVDGIGEPGTVFPIVDLRGKRNEIALLILTEDAPVRTAPLASPIELKPNPLTPPDLSIAKPVDLVMSGGAKDELDMSFMSQGNKIWAFNGVSGMGEAPLFTLKRGESVTVRMRNDTAWPHGMHFHGNHFRIVARGDGKPVLPYWWDTILLEPKDDITIAYAGDNPGRWMIHCHMLDHQAAGMDTWFEVAG
jgi:FtsP/CotA-like multicopper oxidase with cupredoxin domain